MQIDPSSVLAVISELSTRCALAEANLVAAQEHIAGLEQQLAVADATQASENEGPTG